MPPKNKAAAARSPSAASSVSPPPATTRHHRTLTLQQRVQTLNLVEPLTGVDVWSTVDDSLFCNLCNSPVQAQTASVYQHRRPNSRHSKLLLAGQARLGTAASSSGPPTAQPAIQPPSLGCDAPARRARDQEPAPADSSAVEESAAPTHRGRGQEAVPTDCSAPRGTVVAAAIRDTTAASRPPSANIATVDRDVAAALRETNTLPTHQSDAICVLREIAAALRPPAATACHETDIVTVGREVAAALRELSASLTALPRLATPSAVTPPTAPAPSLLSRHTSAGSLASTTPAGFHCTTLPSPAFWGSSPPPSPPPTLPRTEATRAVSQLPNTRRTPFLTKTGAS